MHDGEGEEGSRTREEAHEEGDREEGGVAREEARAAGFAYINSLEPRYQAGRSFKVVRSTGTAGTKGPGTFSYDIYLGDRPAETYRKGGGWQDK